MDQAVGAGVRLGCRALYLRVEKLARRVLGTLKRLLQRKRNIARGRRGRTDADVVRKERENVTTR